MNNSTWMNNGSMYYVKQLEDVCTLFRLVQVEPIVTLSLPDMVEFLKNFTCVNRG